MALPHSTIVSHGCSLLSLCRYSKLRLLISSPSLPLHFNKNVKRLESFHLSAAAASSYFPIDVEYLKREFSGHGATFEDIGETCVAKLKLDNGSSANVMLSRGMVTSYKVKVWHGGKVELLHTWVEQEEEEEVVIRGGVSSAFSSSSDDTNNEWRLHGITGDSNDCVQVELRRSDKKIKEIEMKQIITLRGDTLSIELCVANNGVSPISIKDCSLVSYLTVSTPEATYAVGLEGSDFVEKTPFLPRFGLVQGKDEVEEGKYGSSSGEEESNYKQLSEEMSRIYTLAPSSFTIIDRGRRNSVVVGREGFEEVYMYSPGSKLESYTKSAYVCIGPSSLLNPISLDPGCVWRGVLHLHNPNS
ncbi:hypothetical protein N665_1795s0007 [Sinapis alba]|nr:hypothetical protein N665_1795s0007 [Sinapis alba]